MFSVCGEGVEGPAGQRLLFFFTNHKVLFFYYFFLFKIVLIDLKRQTKGVPLKVCSLIWLLLLLLSFRVALVGGAVTTSVHTLLVAGGLVVSHTAVFQSFAWIV